MWYVWIKGKEESKIRNDIIKVASKAFIENGYDNTSTKEIAKNAGIGAGTLFNYFPSKAEILFEILSDELYDNLIKEDFKIKDGDCAADVIYDFLIAFVRPALSMPSSITRDFVIAFLSIAKKNDTMVQKIIKADMSTVVALESLIDRLKGANLVDSDKSTKILARLIFSGLFLDISLYFFDSTFSKESFHENLKSNIQFLLG